MKKLIITIDLDWACEIAIEETLNFFQERNISPTVFTTHFSKTVEDRMKHLDVGLHPFFGENSSHGKSINEVVKNITNLPHNLKAFRCHRFGVCNLSKQTLKEAGMLISSNVCTNLESINPFQDRFGLLEVPIFLEDGGYLWQKHPLKITTVLKKAIANPGPKVILIHPMHFVVNTPHWDYMRSIKESTNRKRWNQMTTSQLDKLRWGKRGIRDFIIDLLDFAPKTTSIRDLYHSASKPRTLLEELPE
jgi:hypothetical protein